MADDMQIEDMEVVNGTAVSKKKSEVQALNSEFEGIGTTGWAKRLVPEGNQILFKDANPQVTVDSVTIRLLGGRSVKMLFIEESQTMIKSYDGKQTTDGEPISMYPGLRDCFELDFMYPDPESGEEVPHQINCSPTSRYALDDYAKALAKIGKKLTEVDTIVTVVRAVNKQNIRYSKFQFTCKELQDLKSTTPAK
jgi:hypothetical protein